MTIIIDYSRKLKCYTVSRPADETNPVAYRSRYYTYSEAVLAQGTLMQITGYPGQTTHRACVAAGV